MRNIFRGIVLLTLCVLSSIGWGWGKIGHQAVAMIALKHCKPETRNKLTSLLASQQLVPQDLVGIATWPDDIRRTSEDRPAWHYVDYGFSNDGTTPVKPAEDNAERELGRLLATLPSETGDQAGRDLAWLFHLVGDIHQPLHCGTLSNTTFEQGDKGGNLFQVRCDSLDELGKHHHKLTKLHKLWDDIFDLNTAGVTPESVAAEADTGEAVNVTIPVGSEDRAKLLHSWALESSQLAQDYVYRQNGPGSPWLEHHTDLPDGYQVRARQLALVQIKKAGYRLAALLDALLN